MPSKIDEVSKSIGALMAGVEHLSRELADMKDSQAARGVKIDGIANDLAEVKTKVEAMEPKVNASHDTRLKGVGAISVLGLFAGAAGGYLSKKVGLG